MSVETIKFANGNTLQVIDGQYVIGAGGACKQESCTKGIVLNGEYWVDNQTQQIGQKGILTLYSCEGDIYNKEVVFYTANKDFSGNLSQYTGMYNTMKKIILNNNIKLGLKTVDFISSEGCNAEWTDRVDDELFDLLQKMADSYVNSSPDYFTLLVKYEAGGEYTYLSGSVYSGVATRYVVRFKEIL